MGWLAFEGPRAIGMTSVWERRLRVSGEERRIGYWTGLFIDPAHRSSFLYPQLVLAMFAGLRQEGILHLYAAVRRQSIADAHLKIGFKKIADLAVLAKPLRPALLAAKHTGLIHADSGRRWLRTLCGVPDAVVGLGVRLHTSRASMRASEIPWSMWAVEELARLFAAGNSSAASQSWTPELIRARYADGGGRYRLLGVREQDRLLAAVILRLVDRPEGIRAAVVMDLIHAPNTGGAAEYALAAAERLALAEGSDVVLWLDGLPGAAARMVRRRGYLRSREKYSLLLWRGRGGDPFQFPLDSRLWRFTFGDHDMF
jgi:hypothetical protein